MCIVVAMLREWEKLDGLFAQYQHLCHIVESAQMQLILQKTEFYFQKSWVEQSNKLQAPTVDLDVGGKLFRTTPTTISYESDGVLKVLISGDFVNETEEDGSLFIDRDPLQFQHILSYLREPEAFTPPSTAHERNALLREAQYYCLNQLSRGMMALLPTSMQFTRFDPDRYLTQLSGTLLRKCSHKGPRVAIGSHKMERGYHSWQIRVCSPLIAIGIANTEDLAQIQPGSDEHTWMMYGKPAQLWHAHRCRVYGTILDPGDVVQVDLDFDASGGCLSYSINGKPQGIAFPGIGSWGPFYAAVYIYSKTGDTCHILDYKHSPGQAHFCAFANET